MELDDLKNAWQAFHHEQLAAGQLSPNEIQTLLKRRSQSAIAKIKRNLILEIGVLGLLTILLAIPPFLVSSPGFYWLAFSVLVFCFGYMAFIVYYFQEINRQAKLSNNLIIQLRQIITTVTAYQRLYLYSNIILLPVAIAVGFIYSWSLHWVWHKSRSLLLVKLEALDPYLVAGACILGSLLVSLTSIPFIKSYLKQLYGNYVEELKSCLRELEEAE